MCEYTVIKMTLLKLLTLIIKKNHKLHYYQKDFKQYNFHED